VCRGVELDPLYLEVMTRRYQSTAGDAGVLVATGETFEALAMRRKEEAAQGTFADLPCLPRPRSAARPIRNARQLARLAKTRQSEQI
jgi:hypothetical protein